MIEIIAEIGASHNQSKDQALQTIASAAGAGADTVKFQTWKKDTMDCGGHIIRSGPWQGNRLHDLYAKAWTPWEWMPELIDCAKGFGLKWLSTPFDAESVDFLQELGCERYKIASFELTDIPLIRHVAATGKPMILSTGMATVGEIGSSRAEVDNPTLLHCVSSYPAKTTDYSMLELQRMRELFCCDVGLSDHTRSIVLPVMAVAMRATIIERHITISKGGLDDGYASSPKEFAEMVAAVREAEAAMQPKGKRAPDAESRFFRRSLWVTKAVKAGETITADNVRSARPNLGLSPVLLPHVIGHRFLTDVSRETPLQSDHIDLDHERNTGI